jgi:DNA polymerase III subunit delta
MTALKTSEIDAFLARPDPTRPIVLIYGPDAGLVRERAEALIRKSVDDLQDPFALARIEGDSLAEEPTRLVEEAHTVPLFGGRRAIWVRAGSRNIAGAVEAVIAAPPAADCRVVIEAGDLKRSAPLRTICERASKAVAIPCYADGERDLARLIDEEMRAAGLTIAADARTLLLSLIGGDRRASRNELRKLILYAHGQNRVEIDDILAVVADASALALDGIVDAAFGGRTSELETQLAKARVGGTRTDSIVGSALRQAAQLHRARLAMEAGASATEASATFTPPIHFRRKSIIEAALTAWTAARLERTMAQLAEAVLEVRQRPILADAIGERALLSVAVAARRRESQR